MRTRVNLSDEIGSTSTTKEQKMHERLENEYVKFSIEIKTFPYIIKLSKIISCKLLHYMNCYSSSKFGKSIKFNQNFSLNTLSIFCTALYEIKTNYLLPNIWGIVTPSKQIFHCYIFLPNFAVKFLKELDQRKRNSCLI